MEELEIKYADGRTTKLPLVDRDLIPNLLLGDNKRDVVLFGEGNFTFTVALATLRGSFDGIVPTRFEKENKKPVPSFSDVKVEAIKYCVENGRILQVSSDNILNKLTNLCNLPVPINETRRFGVDATNLDDLEVQRKVVWFQCPWASQDHDTDKLLRDVLEEMGRKQSQHDYLLIGITKFFPYVNTYGLQAILGDNLQNRSYHNYDFIGCDTDFIVKILNHGYRHTTTIGIKDLHIEILHDHVTLIFQKVRDE